MTHCFECETKDRAIEILLEEIEQLRGALGQTTHFVTFETDDFAIEHLVSCRASMTSCAVHCEMSESGDYYHEKWGNGRFAVRVQENGNLEKVED